MWPRSLTRDEVRQVDQRAIEELSLPGVVLMENAGRGAAEFLFNLAPMRRVVICAGRGNNGGDGFVIARHLENRGVSVEVVLFAEEASLQGDARINWLVVAAAGTPHRIRPAADPQELAELFAGADWIVDALLGTGTRGEIREPFRTAIDCMNQSGRPILAIDLPSGLDCDSGVPLGPCVRAERTATFVARKHGFDNPESEAWTGRVFVVDIGVPVRCLSNWLGATSPPSA